MSKEIIYCGDIINATNIIDLLDGSSMFLVASPYFKISGVKPIELKSFLEPCYDSKYGVILSAAPLYIKTMSTRPFTSKFTIGWTKGRNIKKEYYVMKPYETDNICDNVRVKLITTPRGEYTEDDAKLCTLDYQLSMVMDILFIAKILDINLATYADLKDNSKFFARFIADMIKSINRLLPEDQHISADDLKLKKSYADSFVTPPTYMSRDKKYFPIEQLGKPKSNIESIWNLFYEAYSGCDLAHNFPKWKSIISENATAMPAFRFIDLVNKSTNAHEKRFDGRITLIMKLTEADKGYNPKIKDFLITQQCNAQTKKFDVLTPQTLPQVWGSSAADPKLTKGCGQIGCIFLVPQLEFKYFKQGRPTIEWRVEQLAIKKMSPSMSGGNNDAMGFITGDDDGEGGDGDGEGGDGEQTMANQYNDGASELPI